MLQENHQAFADALDKVLVNFFFVIGTYHPNYSNQDLGRPAHEAYTMEISTMIDRAISSAKALPKWAAPENKVDDVPDWQKEWRPTVYRTPKGVVLVIACVTGDHSALMPTLTVSYPVLGTIRSF